MLTEIIGVSQAEKEKIYSAALLHDVGKLRISLDILNKPGKLNEAEYKQVRKHSYFGYKYLKSVGADEYVSNCVRWHHEKYCGGNFELHVKGLDIPLGARVIKICDVYDAINNDRPYHKGKSKIETIRKMDKMSEEFDPEIYTMFREHVLYCANLESSLG